MCDVGWWVGQQLVVGVKCWGERDERAESLCCGAWSVYANLCALQLDRHHALVVPKGLSLFKLYFMRTCCV